MRSLRSRLSVPKIRDLCCHDMNGRTTYRWWRRGGVEPPVQKVPLSISYKLSRCFRGRCYRPPPTASDSASRWVFGHPYRRLRARTPTECRRFPTRQGEIESDVTALVRRRVRSWVRQLLFAGCFTRRLPAPRLAMTVAALPVESLRPHPFHYSIYRRGI